MDVNFIINTFAFGYDVDSVLMEDIAKIGNGIYGYCPDCIAEKSAASATRKRTFPRSSWGISHASPPR